MYSVLESAAENNMANYYEIYENSSMRCESLIVFGRFKHTEHYRHVNNGRHIVFWFPILLIKVYEDLPDLHQEFWPSRSRPIFLRY